MEPTRKQQLINMLHHYYLAVITILSVLIKMRHIQMSMRVRSKKRKLGRTYSIIRKIPKRAKYVQKITSVKDSRTKHLLRFTCESFHKFCDMLENVGGLKQTKYQSVKEQVAIFLSILAHHTKNRSVGFHFMRSGQTVSKCFARVMLSVLKLHPVLFPIPKPIKANEDNSRWKWFQGCLGALDGTYVHVHVPLVDKPRYRTRKGTISMNVLMACDITGKFTYVLPGWEGSVADGRILRDAVHSPTGLKVPRGSYYLCDNGYTNGEGFLTPYRGVRYHLKEWGEGNKTPQDHKEYFNMKHSQARNIIERSFGLLKKRWAVFRSNTYYPIHVQSRIIMACALIHNFQLATMPDDLSCSYDSSDSDDSDEENDSNGWSTANNSSTFIDVVETSDAWTDFRDELAYAMYQDYLDRAEYY